MKHPFRWIKDLAWLIRVQAEMLAELGKQAEEQTAEDILYKMLENQ